MQLKATYRISVHAGAEPGTLVGVPCLLDSAGVELVTLDEVALVEGTTFDVGEVTLDVEISSKSVMSADKTPPAKQTTSAVMAAQKAQQQHPSGKR
jgi:hypothetical protein